MGRAARTQLLSLDTDSCDEGDNAMRPPAKKADTKIMPTDVFDDLCALRDQGYKVILPASSVSNAPIAEVRPPTSTTTDYHNQLDPFEPEVLQDWLDLYELGGIPTWPQGTTCQVIRSELSRRSRGAG